jgi:hypothetical protein
VPPAALGAPLRRKQATRERVNHAGGFQNLRQHRRDSVSLVTQRSANTGDINSAPVPPDSVVLHRGFLLPATKHCEFHKTVIHLNHFRTTFPTSPNPTSAPWASLNTARCWPRLVAQSGPDWQAIGAANPCAHPRLAGRSPPPASLIRQRIGNFLSAEQSVNRHLPEDIGGFPCEIEISPLMLPSLPQW